MRKSYPTTYSVVIHRTNEIIRDGLTKNDAHAACREWNSQATTETWARVRSDGQGKTKTQNLQSELKAGLPRLVEGVPVDDLLDALWEPDVSDHPGYLPSPAQIAAGCAAIQAEWGEFERINRAMGFDFHFRQSAKMTPILTRTVRTCRSPRMAKCHLSRRGGRAA